MAGESGVLVLAEHNNGQLLGISTELLGAARRLADAMNAKVTAACLGSGADAAAAQAISYGADAAVTVDSADINQYRNDVWTAALTAVAQEVKPAAVLIGQTPTGRDLAPRFAIRNNTGVAMDCIDLAYGDGKLTMTRPAFGGNAHA